MSLTIDPLSRDTVVRFALKVGISLLVASFGKTPFVLATSGWLALYAMVTAILALMRRERFQSKILNRWDEVLWLTGASIGLYILHESLAS